MEKDKIIEAIREFSAENKRAPKAREVRRGVSVSAAQKFGSWNAAVRAAGLEPNRHSPGVGKDECLRTFRDWAGQKGWSPTSAEWNRQKLRPSTGTIRSLFGSWNEFLKEAGETTTWDVKSAWTKERAIEGLIQWREIHGKNPTENTFLSDSDGKWPSANTLRHLFGSFPEALKQAGLR